MNEGQEHLWHIELVYMRALMRYALDNLDNLKKRGDVQDKLETVHHRLNDLCEITKGENECQD